MRNILGLFAVAALVVLGIISTADAGKLRKKSKQLWTKNNFPSEALAARASAAAVANNSSLKSTIIKEFGKKLNERHFEKPRVGWK